MADVDYQAVAEQQAARIAQLEAMVTQIAARLPIVEVPVEPGGAYPRHVYRKGGKKGQVDHPGNDTIIVPTEDAFHAALLEGWSAEPVPYDPEAAEPEPVVAKKKGGK